MNIKIIFFLLVALSFPACSLEKASDGDIAAAAAFQGVWEASKQGSRADVPLSVFNVELNVSGQSISGRYCFVTQYGNKTDCDPESKSITGFFNAKNGIAKISLKSSFGATGGQAQLKASGGKLQWTLIESPAGGEFYLPQHSILTRAHAATTAIEP